MDVFITDSLSISIAYTEGGKDDAKALAQSQIEKFFDIPSRSFYHLKRYGDGFVIEIHEGGEGFSYLDQILTYLESDDGGVELITRHHKKVRFTLSDENLPVTQVLPDKTLEEDLHTLPYLSSKEKMRLFFSPSETFLQISKIIFYFGALILLSSSILIGANKLFDENFQMLANSADVSLWDIATFSEIPVNDDAANSPAGQLNFTYSTIAEENGINKLYLADDGQFRIIWGSPDETDSNSKIKAERASGNAVNDDTPLTLEK